jgi:hypothetical protein
MRFLLAAILLFSSLGAKADIVFAPGISYIKATNETTTASTDTDLTTYDLRLAYLAPSGLYVGGMYSKMTYGDYDGYSVAASLGFRHYSGFYALFNYHLTGEMDRTATTTMTDGMGPQIDLGWVFPLTHMFFIGPQMTYRSINYKKLDSGGTTSDTDITRSYVMPYVSLWFEF